MLSDKNQHTRDTRIKFFEEDHEYIVDSTFKYISVTTLIKKYFAELAHFKGGEVDFDMMYTFYQFDLLDIIDDCITYYDLEPITIEQI